MDQVSWSIRWPVSCEILWNFITLYHTYVKKRKKKATAQVKFTNRPLVFDLTFNEIKFHVFISEFSIKAFMKHCIKTNKMTLGRLLKLILVQTPRSVMASWQLKIKMINSQLHIIIIHKERKLESQSLIIVPLWLLVHIPHN